MLIIRSCLQCRTALAAAVVAAALAVTAGTARADSYDRWVQVVNNTSEPLLRLFASHVGRTVWGRDHLGHRTLAPGESLSINLDDTSGYCMFDFRGVFPSNDGQEDVVEKYLVNVCEVAVFRFFD